MARLWNDPAVLEPATVLTRCCKVDPDEFSSRLRNRLPTGQPEIGLSLLLGELGPQEAVRRAFRRAPRPRDAVRHATVGSLEAARFSVVPDGKLKEGSHVSVYWHHGEWDDTVAEAFENCFGPPARWDPVT
jgi:hypothetical protein